MDRITWLKEMRRVCEAQYDTRLAPIFKEKRGFMGSFTHQRFIQEFLSLLPPGSLVLDAACGTGNYIPILLEKGHSVVGVDQSQGMLALARTEYPDVHFEKVGLQELAYREIFAGVICIDAMKYICPEDWPVVLSNFFRALKPDGELYFTAETIENLDVGEDKIKQTFGRAQQAGLPVVYGEWTDQGIYHYFPTNRQVREWEGVGSTYRI
jgi:ubiquinone/menaquinone biosynthesis C-methylase UbiE